jgi:hypothetical protein
MLERNTSTVRIALRRLGRIAGAVAALAAVLLPAAQVAATGRILPVAISADVVASDPAIETRDYKGHKAWSILWPRDAEGRELHLGFVETLQLPYRAHPQEMVDFAHDESSSDPAEQTLDLAGRAETLWDRDVFWLLMSERAVLKPTTAGDKLHRGDARRHCAVFTTDPAPRPGTLVGAYCRDLPPGSKVDEATARQWLDDLDLTIAPPEGGMIRAD